MMIYSFQNVQVYYIDNSMTCRKEVADGCWRGSQQINQTVLPVNELIQETRLQERE